MSNARTTSLHERLSTEERKAVERDLIEQPPGRETYAKVFEYHGLADKGVSIKAVERYGGYLRALARNQWIRDFGDAVLGEDLSPRIQGLIRTRMFEALTTGDTKLGDLLKAALAEKSLRETTIKQEEWEAKKSAAAKALAASETGGATDPAQALDRLREDIRNIYGIS